MNPTDRSYRALLRVPTLGRVLLSMQIRGCPVDGVLVAAVLVPRHAGPDPGDGRSAYRPA